MKPREYQTDARDALWAYFANGGKGNPLVLMPTGTGKSVVIGDFVRSVLSTYPSQRVLCLTHVETLIRQNHEKLLRMWPTAPAGIYSAGVGRRDTMQQILFCGIQSVWNKADAFVPPDLVIIDEAHLVGTKGEAMYLRFLEDLRKRNPLVKVIGLTATAWRLNTGRLVEAGIFTDVAIDMTTPEAWMWFVDNGYLSPLYSKKTHLRLDDSNIAVQGGEYAMAQQQRELDKESITRQAVEELVHWGNAENRNCWMVFATGVDHCEHIADMLGQYNVDAVAIHSKHNDAAKRITDFAAGKYRAAVSMNKLTTGVDVAGIDLMGVLRFTKSSSLWVQMLGRGTRPVYADGYELTTAEGRLAAIAAGSKPQGCRVCDFAHNTERLGPVNDPVVTERKGKKKDGGVAPVRICPNCAEYVHTSKTQCPACAYEFGQVLRIEGKSSDAEVMRRKRQQEEQAQPDPVVKVVGIERVTYQVHTRRMNDKPPSMRVSYYANGGLQKFEEYICFEHDGWARKRAQEWWKERIPPDWSNPTAAPATCEQALEFVGHLRVPTSMHVWLNPPGGRPRIQSFNYKEQG